jgi:hypothetical protein
MINIINKTISIFYKKNSLDHLNKIKINLYGNTFSHKTKDHFGYSVHGKISKFIYWVKSGSKISFFVDDAIEEAFKKNDKTIKFAWLLESKYITPEIVKKILANPSRYLDKFEMIFTHNKDLLKIDDKFKWVPAQGFWIKTPKLYNKTKLLSMITSNKSITEGHKNRLEWVAKLEGSVDLYGRGFNEIENKELGLCDYMFSVVIENGIYETYFTEKILDCFATGTIPIYKGAPDIGDYFNTEGIINLTEDFKISNEIYITKLEAVKENLEKVKKMEVLEDFIFENYLSNINIS